MAGAVNRTIKSTQEQAVASWITYLNQVRLDELVAKLNQQDTNLEEALCILNKLKENVNDEIIKSNRGGERGIHGFLAEVLETAFGNARNVVEGKEPEYEWVNDNGPVDLIRNGVNIQQKFVRSGGHYGLEAICEHMKKYPSFLKEGGKYQIPRDFYEKLKFVMDMSDDDIKNYLKSDNPELSLRQIKWIKDFFEKNNISMDDIEPSINTYASAQKGKVNETISDEQENIKEKDKKERQKAYEGSKPTLKEGIKAAGVSATVEGGVTFCMSVAQKRKEKKFSEFSSDDWKDIGIDTGKGVVKGGIRGGSIYVLTNFTATPANVASAYVTAAFGIASQVRALEEGKVSEEDFVINCETVCLDVTVSTIASVAGQLLIPVPVLGAVLGNVAGEFVYELCKKQGTSKSQKIIEGYNAEMNQLNQQLDSQFLQVVLEVQKRIERFKDLEKLAFDEDINIAFNASVNLAIEVGVSSDKILQTKEDIDNFFLI